MICKLQNDILKSTACGYALNEVVEIYLANFEDVKETKLGTPSGECEQVSAITMTSGTTWYKIEPSKNSASYSDTLTVEDNGRKYRVHSLTWTNPGNYDSCAHIDLDALSLGKFIAVVKDADGSYKMLGRLGGLEASAADLTGGNDGSGVTITLDGNAAESVMLLTGAPETITTEE